MCENEKILVPYFRLVSVHDVEQAGPTLRLRLLGAAPPAGLLSADEVQITFVRTSN